MTVIFSQKGDEAPSKDQVECPDGWKWSGEWEVDTNRAVDAEGTICLQYL